MTAPAAKTLVYTMGRSDSETRRLMLQAELLGPLMARFLHEAGITAGMKVLDLGSGPGDVAFQVADIVGESGSVVGIDMNPAVLAVARQRAAEQERSNVTFVEGDCRSASLPDDFDAVVGRFVLLYTGDVTDTLHSVLRHVRPGGVIAFAEPEFSCVLGFHQSGPSAAMRTLWEWANEAFVRSGSIPDMSAELFRAFKANGLGIPTMLLQAPLGGGEAWAGIPWAVESLRSIRPLIEQYEIATAADLDLETLGDRVQAESEQLGTPFMLIPVVTAWANKPIA
jgi:SAM-dependent methyltransferase